jgi:hypothetical protein
MTVESESNRPNEFGFAGDPATPQPRPVREPVEQVEGEKIAVPSGDLTGAISDAIEEMTEPGTDDDRPDR